MGLSQGADGERSLSIRSVCLPDQPWQLCPPWCFLLLEPTWVCVKELTAGITHWLLSSPQRDPPVPSKDFWSSSSIFIRLWAGHEEIDPINWSHQEEGTWWNREIPCSGTGIRAGSLRAAHNWLHPSLGPVKANHVFPAQVELSVLITEWKWFLGEKEAAPTHSVVHRGWKTMASGFFLFYVIRESLLGT